jgi:hypothetical protein
MLQLMLDEGYRRLLLAQIMALQKRSIRKTQKAQTGPMASMSSAMCSKACTGSVLAGKQAGLLRNKRRIRKGTEPLAQQYLAMMHALPAGLGCKAYP